MGVIVHAHEEPNHTTMGPTSPATTCTIVEEASASEMATMPSIAKESSVSSETGLGTRNGHLIAAKKHISRPDSLGFILDADFNMAPNRITRRQNKCSNGSSVNETSRSLEATTECLLAVTAPEPQLVTSGQGASGSKHQHVQTADNENNTKQTPTDIALPNTKLVSKTDTLTEHLQNGKNGTISENATNHRYRIRSDSLQHSPSDIQSPIYENEVSDSTETQPNGRSLDSCTRPIDSPPKAIGPQARLESQYRVTKTKATPSNKYSNNNARLSNTSLEKPSIKTPSEEDLLYLLMHHARQREYIRSETRQQQRRLEEDNEKLQDLSQNLQHELEDMTAERDRLTADAERNRDDIEKFKTKYAKLKKWALEMNSEYAAIRQEGGELKSAIAELRISSHNIQESLHVGLESNDKGADTVVAVKHDLKTAQESLHALRIDLKTAQEALAAKSAELVAVKSLTKSHEKYAREIVEVQRALDKRTTACQKRIAKVLVMINNKIDLLPDQREMVDQLSTALQIAKEVSIPVPDAGSDFKMVSSSIAQVFNHLQSFQESVESSLQTFHETNDHFSLTGGISAIKRTVETLQPGLTVISDLRQNIARLEQRIDGDSASRALIQEAKQMAENRQAETQLNNNKLIEALTTVRDDESKCYRQALSDAEARFSEVILKWNVANKELGETRDELKLIKNEASLLQRRLEDCENIRNSEKDELMTQNRLEIQVLKDEANAMQRNMTLNWEAQILDRERQIATWIESCKGKQREIDACEQKVQGLLADKRELADKLEEARSAVELITGTLERQNQAYDSLVQELKEMQNLKTAYSALEQSNAEQVATINRLGVDHSKFIDIQKDLSSAKAECGTTKEEMIKLSEKLAEVERYAHDKDELEQRVSMYEEEAKELKLTINKTEQQVVSLEKQNAENATEISRLHNLLEDEQHKCQLLEEAEVSNKKLQQQVQELQKELSLSAERTSELTTLKEANHTKDTTIKSLQTQVSILPHLETQLDVLKKQLQEAGRQLSPRCEEPVDFLSQSVQQDSNQMQALNEDLDAVFTQNTNITVTSPTSQVTGQGADVEDRWPSATGMTDSNLQQNIDPRVIMGATPLNNPTPTFFPKSISQGSIIPDSQLDSTDNSYCDGKAKELPFQSGQRTSSPLSDLDKDNPDTDMEGHCDHSDSGGKAVSGWKGRTHHEAVEDVFEIPAVSPKIVPKHRTRRRIARRPSSVISQDDMLFHSSGTGRNSSPSAKISHRSQPAQEPRSRQDLLHHNLKVQHGHSSPYEARTGPQDQTTALSSRTTRAMSREPNRPNSAVKRRVDDTTLSVNNRFDNKRLRAAADRTRPTTSSTAPDTAVNAVTSSSGEGLSATSRRGTMTSTETTGSVERRNSRRLKPSRKFSKQAKYSAQFNGNNQA